MLKSFPELLSVAGVRRPAGHLEKCVTHSHKTSREPKSGERVVLSQVCGQLCEPVRRLGDSIFKPLPATNGVGL